MPIVRFLGFPDGETVSMAASQGSETDSATVESWKVAADGGTAPSVAIDVVRAPSTAQYAPEAIWFYATPSDFSLPEAPENSIAYDPAFHEIEYEWDFGDAGDTFGVPQNMLAQHRDANSAVGQQAAHVYRAPGIYTVKCTARLITDPSIMQVEEAEFTTQVEVGDMETLWTEDNTVVVAHDGDFNGAPPSNFQLTEWTSDSNTAHWIGLLWNGNIPSSGPVRVLFKRGGNYPNNVDGLAHRAAEKSYTFLHFGAWGTGANPIANETRGRSGSVPTVWRDIHFKGNYDPDTEVGEAGFTFRTGSNFYCLMTGCDFSNRGGGFAHFDENNNNPSTNTLHDCRFYDLAAYGVFHKGKPEDHYGNGTKDRFAMLGCMDIDSASQPHGLFSPNGQKQGPMRGLDFEDVIVQGCEFFCRVGWTGQGDWDADGIAMSAVQPAIRFAEGRPETGTLRNGNVVVSRCTSEGAGFVDVNGDQDAEPRVGNMLVDQNLLVAVPSARSFGKSEAGSLTWRNCLHIKPNVADSPDVRHFLEIQITGKIIPFDEVARRAEPVRIYSNTFIALDASEPGENPFQGIEGYTNYLDTNNVIYVEGNPAYVRHEEIAPVDDAVLWQPRYKGRREWTSGAIEPLRTQYEPPADTISLYRPEATSGIVDDAMGTISYTDLLGTERVATQSRGALEP